MSFTIPCSYGELVDKWTILGIKQNKCPVKETTKLNNITRELELIGKSLIDQYDPLVHKLKNINIKLWNLENEIREYGQDPVLVDDQVYIGCAKSIHITNDLRYDIKRQLNEKYGSELREEKIYNHMTINADPDLVQASCMYALDYFPHDANKCYDILHRYINNVNIPFTPVGVLIYMNYLTVTYYVGEEDAIPEDFPKIDGIIRLIDAGILTENSYKVQVALQLLRDGRYQDSYRFLPYIHSATGPYGIAPSNTCNFKPGDCGKTMVVYSSGGLGDIIMFSRFVPMLCVKFKDNQVIYMVKKSMLWMFREAFKDVPNLWVVSFDCQLPPFQYHNNIAALLCPLGITQASCTHVPYLKTVKGNSALESQIKNYILFGWKGSETNQHEVYNRRVPLAPLLESLSELTLELVTVQRDVTEEEYILLQKYQVRVIDCDNAGLSFYDTLTLVKNAKLVVSSDTSLLHLAATARTVGVVALIVRGCEWRWTSRNRSSWYPNVKVLQQSKYQQWSKVLHELSICD
jgi:hypothetical protein